MYRSVIDYGRKTENPIRMSFPHLPKPRRCAIRVRVRLSVGLVFAVVLLLRVSAASADIEACDRNYDQKITISDALVALQAAVSPCLKELYCDADGDGSESVTDALAILQYAVALPVTLECEFDTDCADGFVCDGCTYTCYEAAGAAGASVPSR